MEIHLTQNGDKAIFLFDEQYTYWKVINIDVSDAPKEQQYETDIQMSLTVLQIPIMARHGILQ